LLYDSVELGDSSSMGGKKRMVMNNLSRPIKKPFVNVLFFFILIAIILASFKFDFKFDLLIENPFLWAPMIVFISIGLIFVFMNKERINEIMEGDREVYERERVKEKEFYITHPGISRIPGLKSLAGLIYVEGWCFSIVFFLIILTSTILLSYNLGGADLYEDEYQVTSAAEGYLRTGTFYRWDYIKNELSQSLYDRAWPHTWMIAQSYRFFGISEWSSRIVSVVFGVFFIVIFYFISKFFTRNKWAALLTVFCIMLSPRFVDLFRYARMYAVFIPIFSLLFYCAYRFIVEQNTYSLGRVAKWVNRNFNFNYAFLLPSLVLLYFNYQIHLNSLVILPIAFLFIVLMACCLRERKYVIASAMGVGIAAALASVDSEIMLRAYNYFTFFKIRQFEYLDYVAAAPFNVMAGIILLVSGLLMLVSIQNKEIKIKILYLYTAIIFSMVFFIFIANRYQAFKYISHIVPVAMLLAVYMVLLFSRVPGKTILPAVFVLLLIGCSMDGFARKIDAIYGETHEVLGNPSKAYQTLIEKYDPKTEVIFAQYFRNYYMRNFGNEARIINMLNKRQYEFKTFWKDINKYGAGWVVFETRKKYHLDPRIVRYIDEFFRKYHGEGKDDTNIEMYYFNREMIRQSIFAIISSKYSMD
jgi:hypothetical protein